MSWNQPTNSLNLNIMIIATMKINSQNAQRKQRGRESPPKRKEQKTLNQLRCEEKKKKCLVLTTGTGQCQNQQDKHTHLPQKQREEELSKN